MTLCSPSTGYVRAISASASATRTVDSGLRRRAPCERCRSTRAAAATPMATAASKPVPDVVRDRAAKPNAARTPLRAACEGSADSTVAAAATPRAIVSAKLPRSARWSTSATVRWNAVASQLELVGDLGMSLVRTAARPAQPSDLRRAEPHMQRLTDRVTQTDSCVRIEGEPEQPEVVSRPLQTVEPPGSPSRAPKPGVTGGGGLPDQEACYTLPRWPATICISSTLV
jgi:hypothetical protein